MSRGIPPQGVENNYNTLVKFIKEGDYEGVKWILSSLSLVNKEHLKKVTALKVNGHPLAHYAIRQINLDNPDTLLIQKDIADLFISPGGMDPNLSIDGKSYNDLFSDYLFDFIVQTIGKGDIETLKIYLEEVAITSPETREILTKTLRYDVTFNKLTYSLPQYCIASILLSGDIKPLDTPHTMARQKQIAELLFRYGADSKQTDHRDRTYDEYLEKYPRIIFKQIYQYVIGNKSEELAIYLEKLKEHDPESLQKTLEKGVVVDNPQYTWVMPIQHFCIHCHRHSNHELNEGEEIANIILPYIRHEQTDALGQTYEEYLAEIRGRLSGRESRPVEEDSSNDADLSTSPRFISPEDTPEAPDTPRSPRRSLPERRITHRRSSSEPELSSSHDTDLARSAEEEKNRPRPASTKPPTSTPTRGVTVGFKPRESQEK